MYGSTEETKKHIRQVKGLLTEFIVKLCRRSSAHDASKLVSPEKEVYDLYTPFLSRTPYGSEDYKYTLENMSDALQHHYQVNRHHPEHFDNNIDGMNLVDLVEMLADWKAASMRNDVGDLLKSLEINRDRFGITEQLYHILENTIKDMGWDRTSD